jgi:hypothetical protein
MSTSMSVLFYARKSMANNQGEYPIYMRITIAGVSRSEESVLYFRETGLRKPAV